MQSAWVGCGTLVCRDVRCVFEVRAQYCVENKTALNEAALRLGHSVAAHAIAQGKSLYGRLPQSDPFFAVAKDKQLRDAHYLLFRSCLTKSGHGFCSSLRKVKSAMTSSRQSSFRRDHFELLVASILQAEHVDSIEVFATQGRLAQGAMHELRNRLGELEADLIWPGRLCASPQRNEAASHIAAGLNTLSEVRDIALGSLDNVQRKRGATLAVDEAIARIVAYMQLLAREKLKRREVTFHTGLGCPGLLTAISPSPLNRR